MADQTLTALEAMARSELRDRWTKYRDVFSRGAGSDVIHEIADASVPVYTSELLALANGDHTSATDEPELGPTFDTTTWTETALSVLVELFTEVRDVSPGDAEEALEHLAQKIGYSVEYTATSRDVQGICDLEARRIVVDETLNSEARIHVLIHELGHALGLTYEQLSRYECEAVVEAISLAVGTAIGVDARKASFGRIADAASRGSAREVLLALTSRLQLTIDRLERSTVTS
jgi:hypothetical protein